MAISLTGKLDYICIKNKAATDWGGFILRIRNESTY